MCCLIINVREVIFINVLPVSKVSCKVYSHHKSSSSPFSFPGSRHPPRNSPQSSQVQANYIAPKGQAVPDSFMDSVKAVDSFQSLIDL